MDIFRAQGKAKQSALTTDGFDNFISRLGLNNDNALSGGTYEFNLITRNRILLEQAYRGSWIVGRVVDSVADDMTRAGINLTTNEADEDIKDFQTYMSRMQVWQSISAVIKWGRLYGGCVGVMQIDGQKLDTPLDPETISEGQFKGIIPFDRWQLNPDLTRVIESGPQMGLPAYYQIVNNPAQSTPTSPTSTGELTVHHSRVIRYTGIDLPFFQAITEMMWGESVLERLWDRLISFDNASLSSASLVDRANLRTVRIEGLREIIAAGGKAQEGLEAQFEMMRRMQVNEGITLLDKNDEFASTAYTFAGLSDMMLQFAQQLSGGAGIPLVILFMQSPAGLNATGDADLRMYYDAINSMQESKLRFPFETLLKVMWRSKFGKPIPKDLEFSFNPLWQMSDTDKATVAKTNTETVIGAFEAGLAPREAAMKELRQSSGDTGLFSNISDEDIQEAELEEPPTPQDPAGSSPEEKAKEPVKNIDRNPFKRIKKYFARDAFNENDHPRKDDGKFGSGGGSGGSSYAEKTKEVEKGIGNLASSQERQDKAEAKLKQLQSEQKHMTPEYTEAAKEYRSAKRGSAQAVKAAQNLIAAYTAESKPVAIHEKDKDAAIDALAGKIPDKHWDEFMDKFDEAIAGAKIEKLEPKEASKIKRSHGHTFTSDPGNEDLHKRAKGTRGKEVNDPSIVVKLNGELYALDGQHRLNRAIADGNASNVAIIDGEFLKKFGITEKSFGEKKSWE